MPHVLITGGSSGIGLALAKHYACRGIAVSLIARGIGALETARDELGLLGAGAVHIEPADVTDGPALSAAIAGCEAALGPFDTLIASAGIVEPAMFDAQSTEAFDRQIAVNLAGCVHAVRAVYPAMKARGHGRIMLVSSGAGLIGIPGYAAYCASKFALRGFAEALRFEARPHGVSISICYPPDTETPQLARERALRPRDAEIIMGRVSPWSAEKVAASIVGGMDGERFEVFFSPTLTVLGRLGPLVRPLVNLWFDHALRRSRTSHRSTL